ncbi:mannosylglycerate hydrolase [Eubacterium sp.]|uniref:mannosylglycerate hydrolase n=1 Tax=Eubacterium sp. TaxID=142586 RepID=UPI00399AD70E
MKRKIHVVPHSHWDREWYFTTSRSKVYLMKDLGDVLDTLESDPEFKYFMVDAQGSLLDDYIKWRPQDKERITKLVKMGKLVIGPWYTQTDQLVISGESIVRNMYYGMKRCESFGKYMNVGYVPDSFGQSGNMPQIYRKFGIEDTLFWRGVSDDMVEHTDFNWKGDDGSVVFTTQIPFGYYIGGKIPEDPKENDEFWEKECLEKAGGRSATRHIYFPNGFDQAPIRTNLPQLIKERNEKDPENEYVISCIEDYIKDVKSEKPELEEVQGELVIAKHMRIHKSIFSSRSDLKVMNTQIQNYVTNVMEPLLTISYNLGNEYPHEAVAEIWKLLFENSAHDSIGSCISDTANEDVYVRYKQARDIAINLVELHSRLIATNVKNSADMTFTLINTLPQKREDTVIVKTYVPGGKFAIVDEKGNNVDYTIIQSRDLTDYVLSQIITIDPSRKFYIPDHVFEVTMAIKANDVPALGYVQYSVDTEKDSHKEMEEKSVLENEYYTIEVEKDGSLTIVDKENNVTYKNQGILVENGDDGDSFNYSPPRKDLEVFSNESESSVKISGSDVYSQAVIHFDMVVPENLEERAEGKVSVTMPVDMTVALRKGSKVIDFNVKVDNKGLSHRLCVVFDSQIVSAFNYADQQFGLIKRPNYYEKEMKLYMESMNNRSEKKTGIQELANWANDQSTWQEPPISIEPTQSYVSLTDGKTGVAVIPQGVREYEVLDDSKIRLTLFRTYGFMGKENLIYRPGRASGERIIETPAAQLLKQMEFNFGFTTYAGDINDADIDTLAKQYDTNMEVYTYAEFLNGRLIFSQREIEGKNDIVHSLFETEGNLVVSAIKKAEEDDGYIIRLYNGKDHRNLDDKIKFNFDVKEAYYTNLREEKTEAIKVENNTISVKELSHCKFVTIWVK